MKSIRFACLFTKANHPVPDLNVQGQQSSVLSRIAITCRGSGDMKAWSREPPSIILRLLHLPMHKPNHIT
jgi:hypothetical protein